MRIGFIGGGNMAEAIIKGLLQSGWLSKDIWVSDPHDEKLKRLESDYNVQVSSFNHDVCQYAEVLILAVKPQAIAGVLTEIAPSLLQIKPGILSIVAGVPIQKIKNIVGNECDVIRCMPNTGALYQLSATGLYTGENTSPKVRQACEAIMDAVGVTYWFSQEDALNKVTAVSGSGPAYFYYLLDILNQDEPLSDTFYTQLSQLLSDFNLEQATNVNIHIYAVSIIMHSLIALYKAGVEVGLSAAASALLSKQTLQGVIAVAQSVDIDLTTLRKNVTSKGGTTEAGLAVMQASPLAAKVVLEETLTNEIKWLLEATFNQAVKAAYQRSVELSACI